MSKLPKTKSRDKKMHGVDLAAIKKKVRKLNTTAQLFQLWNAVCRLYDRQQINSHELDEIQTVICSQFKHVESRTSKDMVQAS